ncbi:MAG: DUF4258 domain-containing protein [Chitinophagaceae bacterium]
MGRKWVPYFLILGLAIALFVVRRCNQVSTYRSPAPKSGPSVLKKHPSPQLEDPSPNRDRGFDRRTSFLEYTMHARCRMECRQITEAEVEQIMLTGTINYAKSRVKAKPCPEYAVEGTTADAQRVRFIFAQCDQKTKVVTVIDLGREWTCDCAGDNKKYRN